MIVGFGAYESYDVKPGGGGVLVTGSNGGLQLVQTPKPRTYLPAAKKSAWRELTDR
jgi:hypothetical protein